MLRNHCKPKLMIGLCLSLFVAISQAAVIDSFFEDFIEEQMKQGLGSNLTENDEKDLAQRINFIEEQMELGLRSNLTENDEKDLALRINCEDTKGSFFGLEFSLSGYNIIHGYPKESSRDPGWRSPIFEANFDTKKYTSDCSYLLPAGIDMQRAVACATTFTSKETKTQLDFSKKLAASASVSGSGWGASFSASTTYQTAVEEMTNKANVYVFSEARCVYRTAIMNPGLPPPLSKGFLTYIKDLETVGTKEKYFDFFENYGTHFAKSIDFGARYTRTHEMSSEAYKKISDSAYSVEATASYDGTVSVSGSASLSEEQRKAVDSFRKDVTTSQSTLGALPPSDGNHNTWAAEVKKTPAPILYKLESIEKLFTAAYFKGVTGCDYNKIKDNIIKYKAKSEYCAFLIKRGDLSSCDVPTEPLCQIPTVQYGSFTCHKPSGIETTVVRDGDSCTATCNAGLFLVDAVNPTIKCSAFGHLAKFDKTPSCKKYDLMHLQAASGHYRLSYSEAESLCKSNGARVATLPEIQTAYNQGLNLCSCGWVDLQMGGSWSNVFGVYPMQSSIDGCGSRKGINVCSWSPRKWNAWCHL